MFNRFRLVKLLFLVLLFGYLFCIAFALTETEIKCSTEKDNQYCYKAEDEALDTKYLYYDVDPLEGFNLRRDVYIRIANMINFINRISKVKWVLVLPAWNELRHWKSRNIIQSKLNWSNFFNITSLNEYIPVIELENMIKQNNKLLIDTVYFLENDFSDMDKGEFYKLNILDNCDQRLYSKQANVIKGNFWNFKDKVKAKECKKVLFRGSNYFMAKSLLSKLDSKVKHVMIDRAEVLIHEEYGQEDYWKCRRSMKISSKLVEKSVQLRQKFFNSNLINTNSNKLKDKGDNYLGVHVRRGDFVKYRKSVSLEKIAEQIKQISTKLNVTKVYLSTDGVQKEINQLISLLGKLEVYSFNPSEQEIIEYKDGGVSIIDQLICSHARYFIGTQESTFSFRIQEEREILGFDPSTTFNCFCDKKEICQTTKWLIKN